jgi:hypothetical protein
MQTIRAAMIGVVGLFSVSASGPVEPVEPSPMQVSMQCGVAPIPPVGCRVGSCVCDRSPYGGTSNCHWTFVCR